METACSDPWVPEAGPLWLQVGTLTALWLGLLGPSLATFMAHLVP